MLLGVTIQNTLISLKNLPTYNKLLIHILLVTLKLRVKLFLMTAPFISAFVASHLYELLPSMDSVTVSVLPEINAGPPPVSLCHT